MAGLIVPAAFAESVANQAGDAGRAWIAGLPATVDALCSRWGLTIDGEPMHGYLGLVVPVGGDHGPAVLKVSWADESTAHEIAALAAWDGRGAVRLLAADPELRAMLLERLDSSRSLADIEIGEALVEIARLARRLSVPGPAGIPRLQDVAAEMTESLGRRWEALGRPIPHPLIDAARDLAADLGPGAGSLLVNWDLHYGNVLAGTREPWLAIDPKALIGDPEYGLAQSLWTRLEDFEASSGLGACFDALVDGAGLDPRRAAAWSLVRCVDYCLWALGVGLTEDPVRCVRIASWLLAERL